MADVAARSWRSYRAEFASLKRSRPDDDPDLLAARRNLREAKLAEQIRAAVNAAPPLTQQQKDRLAALLRGGGAHDAA